MFKRFLSTAMAIVTMFSLCSVQTFAANGYDYEGMKKAYTEKVEAEKKNSGFLDAYVIDVYNNNEPALIVASEAYGGADSKTYLYSDGNVVESTALPVFTDTLGYGIFSDSASFLSYGGGSGGGSETYVAKDKDGKIYFIRSYDMRIMKHNVTEEAEFGYLSDFVNEIELGYYSGTTYHLAYKQSYYLGYDKEFRHIVSSKGYNEDGSSYDLDVGYKDEDVLSHFGLTRLIENPYSEVNKKGSQLFKFWNYDPITINLNGTTLSLSKDPVIINGSTLVPMREIFEAMGAKVDWDGETQTVTGTTNGTTVNMTIGSSAITKNGVTSSLGVPAQLIDGYTMVPVRAVAESFGAKVDWDGTNKIVSINS